MRGRPPSPDPRAVAWLNRVMAALYLLIAALVVYFRVVPVRKVLDRLVRDGVDVPGWLPATLTLGAVVVAGYLAFQGLRAFRRARNAR